MRAVEFIAALIRLAPLPEVNTFEVSPMVAKTNHILVEPHGDNRPRNADGLENYFDENVRIMVVREKYKGAWVDSEALKKQIIKLHPDMSAIVLDFEAGTPKTCQISQISLTFESGVRRQLNNRKLQQWAGVFRILGEVLTPVYDDVYIGPY